MVDVAVVTPAPSTEAQTRFYAANKLHFITGQALQSAIPVRIAPA